MESLKEVIDGEALRQRAVEQHLKALRSGKTSLMISPRHEGVRTCDDDRSLHCIELLKEKNYDRLWGTSLSCPSGKGAC